MILIAGLTASGKSQLALDIARSMNAGKGRAQEAVIINADSMQVYDGLRVLTARPPAADLAQAPHYLYGFVDAACRFSAGAWLKAVEKLLQQPEMQGKTCIFVGGTGLYFHALLGGLAEIPPISAAVRQKGQNLLAEKGVAGLYAALQSSDSMMAARLSPQDSQRIMRAWEVWEETGKSLGHWQSETNPPLIQAEKARKLVLLPPQAAIYAQINARVDKMVEQGAPAEVKALRARRLDPQLPLMKAAGVREFYAYLDGETDLPAAIDKTKQATRHYAKRQRTWFSRRLSLDWQVFVSAAAAGRAIF
ncbi:MAG: tRNA (adenosine(37)-N6)-dimethylallyltransferase MiaA [Candidatus Tokpelaia sp.]|nr:MAG: tRNA (adenosine(37)-N6)-dimethylallyltransferase MiaA [Candidatus Tokpelaia sp.]KAA6206700.1 MAG: tRNA (adenosine(37)-N6)-dimethylallyltransferase MiaA [Candidatus Tokpelaia sp.]